MRILRLRPLLAVAALLAFPASAHAQPPRWTPLGPFGGFVESITPDPAQSGVLYAATSAGVYKTSDAGGSWTLVYAGFLSSGQVAVDPLHPSTLYLTGASQDALVLKSVDGGAHWSPADAGLPRYYSILAVDPARPRRLYVGTTGGGFWRSLDAGASWQPASDTLPDGGNGFVLAIAPASRPAGKVLVTTSRGVYGSVDGGAHWSRVGGLPTRYADAVAFAPSDPRTVYAYLAGNGISGAGDLYRSKDGGVSWRSVLRTGGNSVIREISISAASPRLVYLRSEDRVLFRSADGGDHWTRLPASPATAVAADPFSAATVYSSLLTGPDLGGVWRSGDQGKTWEQRSQGMTGIGATSLAIDRKDPDRLWTVSGLPLRTTNGGERWARMRMPPGESGAVQVSAGPGSQVFLLTWRAPVQHFELPTYSLWKTGDDGASWTHLPASSAGILLFRLASSTLYAADAFPTSYLGSVRHFLRSADGGAHWEIRLQTTLSCGLGDLAVAPSAPAVVYLGGCKDSNASAVLRSGDGGATFSDVSDGLPGPYVQALAVDPRDPNTLWAGTGGLYLTEAGDGVWKSTNGGGSWTRAGGELAGLTITALLAPEVPGRVYAAALDGRIFRSEDGGATWEDWTGGLPPSRVFSLQAAPDDPHRIYAATSQGIWTLVETD